MNDTTTKPTINVTVSRMTDAIAVGAKGTLKRNLVGTTDGDYPQTLEFEFFGKNVDLLEGVRPGDVVEIKYDLRGREWTNPNTGKTSVFVTLSAFGLTNMMDDIPPASTEPVAAQQRPQQQQNTPPNPPGAKITVADADEIDEVLPF